MEDEAEIAVLHLLHKQGYYDIIVTPNGVIYGLYNNYVTTLIACDLNLSGAEKVYVYSNEQAAKKALELWAYQQFEGEPIGYIRRK